MKMDLKAIYLMHLYGLARLHIVHFQVLYWDCMHMLILIHTGRKCLKVCFNVTLLKYVQCALVFQNY
jgi:hypothetical protein